MVPPDYVKQLKLSELPVHFKDLPLKRLPIDAVLARKSLKLSPRGVIALAAAMSEWVVWRIDAHHDFESERLVEAMWACSVHPSYLAPFQIDNWPKPSDPVWDSPPSKAFLSIQHHFRKLIEGMIGYQQLHDISNWCYNVLETGMFKNKKNRLESTIGKELATTFHSWLHETTDKISSLSPANEITYKCLIEQTPSQELQSKFSWGSPISRRDIHEEILSHSERTKTIDSFLKGIKDNPYLCNKDTIQKNKCWVFSKHGIPMPKGAPYTFNEEMF
ncbi:MAG: hypothetical protein H2058_06540 [Muricauda sp.]|nr:hypothetical protein [Allomuricauda sp.]MBA4744896.1 hypothetical protein [Allomuricauda sp.]